MKSMSIQSIIVIVIVGTSAFFLLRQGYIAMKKFFSPEASSCGKCGFAKPTDNSKHIPPAIKRRNEIAQLKSHSKL